MYSKLVITILTLLVYAAGIPNALTMSLYTRRITSGTMSRFLYPVAVFYSWRSFVVVTIMFVIY